MPDVEWPVGMGFALAEGFENGFPVLAERSGVDSGPAKQRRLTTAAPQSVQLSYLMTTLQREWLEQFWFEDAAGGAVWFKWFHPVKQAWWRARFLAESPPSYRPYKPDWIVSVALEALRPW